MGNTTGGDVGGIQLERRLAISTDIEEHQHHIAALAAQRGRRFRPISDLLAGKVLAPPPLFDGFLLQKSLVMLVSQPGVGKTWLLDYMTLCGEQNLPLFDRFKPHKSYNRSLMFALDSNPWDVAKQFMKLGRGMGIGGAPLDSFIQLRDKRVNMLDKGLRTWMLDFIQSTKTNMVMIDTMRKATTLNLNDDREADVWMDMLDELRSKTGATIIFTNHVRKVQQGFMDNPLDAGMGSRVLTGGCDFVMMLGKTQSKEISLTMPKGREDMEWEELRYKLVHGGPPAARETRIVPMKTSADVYKMLLEAMPDVPVTREWLVDAALSLAAIEDRNIAAKIVDNFTQKGRREGVLINPQRGMWQRSS